MAGQSRSWPYLMVGRNKIDLVSYRHCQPCSQAFGRKAVAACILLSRLSSQTLTCVGSERLRARVPGWGWERQGLTITKPLNSTNTSHKELKYILILHTPHSIAIHFKNWSLLNCCLINAAIPLCQTIFIFLLQRKIEVSLYFSFMSSIFTWHKLYNYHF